jgi:hypothetical protein
MKHWNDYLDFVAFSTLLMLVLIASIANVTP